MKSKGKKCSSKTSGLVSQSMKEETKKALKYLHEIAEEIRKQKQLAKAG